MEVESKVERIGEALNVGDRWRGTCPACGGGSSGETSCVVGREQHKIWWKCFRAACNSSGIVGAAHLPLAVKAEVDRALQRIRIYDRPAEALLDSDHDYFRKRFEIETTGTPFHVMRTATDEYLLPIRAPDGRRVRGYVVRQPVWKGIPKAPRYGRDGYFDDDNVWQPMPKTVLYAHTTEPMVSWYRSAGFNSHLLLVEDQLSAIKCAQQLPVTAVALLGNGVNIEVVRELFKFQPRVVTIALDPGADGQAQSLAKKWGLYFEKTRVVPLEADPKDIPADDLMEALGL